VLVNELALRCRAVKTQKMTSSSYTGIQFSTKYRKYFDSVSVNGRMLKLNAGNVGEC